MHIINLHLLWEGLGLSHDQGDKQAFNGHVPSQSSDILAGSGGRCSASNLDTNLHMPHHGTDRSLKCPRSGPEMGMVSALNRLRISEQMPRRGEERNRQLWTDYAGRPSTFLGRLGRVGVMRFSTLSLRSKSSQNYSTVVYVPVMSIRASSDATEDLKQE